MPASSGDNDRRSPVISLASTKGGVGKTTLAFVLATELSRRLTAKEPDPGPSGIPGCRVCCIDADPNRTLSEALRLAATPQILCVESNGERLLPDLREAQSQSEIILIDLEGSANQAMLYAAGKSDLVLIPAQPSRFDVLEAVKTAGVVRQAADLVGREIAHRVVLSRTPVLRQRVADHSRTQFVKADLPLLSVEIVQRSAFQTMTYTGKPPYLQDADSGASRNVEALVDEVMSIVGIALSATSSSRSEKDAGNKIGRSLTEVAA